MRKTLIETATGLWVNVIVLPDDWTGAEGEWQIPDGHKFVDGNGSSGYVWNGSSFDAPAPPPPPPPPPEPTWQEIRISAYGSWGDQLDMQYWDGLHDTTVWSDHIAKVKSDHPKPL